MVFDMNEFCNKPWKNLGKFSLMGLILHKGETIESGHYEAFTKRYDSNWYYCNDSTIKVVKL